MPSEIQLLPSFHAKSIRENGKQYYLNINGDRLPSVSTILNATKPQADRDRLFNWKQRVGVETASQISSTASRRGTQTHRYIQRYLQGEAVSCSEASRPYWESIAPVLQEINVVRLVEATVFHSELKYAGIVDCVASYQGVPCVCEWKTADKPKGSLERLYDYPLQLAAYLGAVNHFYRDYDIQLNRALIVIAIPQMPAEIFWFEPETIASYWQQWQQRVAAYWQYISR